MNPARLDARWHPHRRAHPLLLAALVALAAASTLVGRAEAQPLDPSCSLEHGTGAGPFDYRNQRSMLAVVEKRHFTRRVEMGLGGGTTARPGPDLHYTLNKFPNHHRALATLSKLGLRLKADKVPQMDYPVTCYFERAVRFRPDDTIARLLYAQHLGAVGRADDALPHLALAAQHAGDNPLTHYNIGLVALEVKAYDRALEHAHIAYAAGMPAPALREGLAAAGKWVEPAAAPADAAASAATPR